MFMHIHIYLYIFIYTYIYDFTQCRHETKIEKEDRNKACTFSYLYLGFVLKFGQKGVSKLRQWFWSENTALFSNDTFQKSLRIEDILNLLN